MKSKRCGLCNKIIKKRPRVCCTCKTITCVECSVNGKCKDCLVESDKRVVYDYFADKYKKAVYTSVIMLFIFLVLSIPVSSQLITDKLKTKDCVSVEYDCYEEPVFTVIETLKNGTKIQVIDSYNTVCKTKDVCKEIIEIDNKDIEYKLKGYECKESAGVVICDSCRDGNCDGVCNPNGGETCVKITDTGVIHKNSKKEWVETSIPVERLVS